MLLPCWVLLGIRHMPTHDSLGSVKVQTVSLLWMQTSEDQRLRSLSGIQAGALCRILQCGRSETRIELEELSRVHTMQPSATNGYWVISSGLYLLPPSLATSVSPGPVEDSLLVGTLKTQVCSLFPFMTWPCSTQLSRLTP